MLKWKVIFERALSFHADVKDKRSKEEKGMNFVFTFKRRYKIALLLLTLVMVLLGVIGKNGVLSLYGLRKQYRHLITGNEVLKKSNQSLRHQIYLLKEDKSYIEKIAREEMGLVKKDEVILRFEK